MRTIVTVLGARPQFVKAAPLSVALRDAGLRERLVHTGQHYDAAMSDFFFEELSLPEPAHHLGVGSGSHGAQTGRALERVESVLLAERPDLVLVYGDTNSTLAGALAAAKLHIPVAHVEAGLRSFNRSMPEEINRVLTDQISALLFAPTDAAMANLAREGINTGVIRTGDVMFDLARLVRPRADARLSELEARFNILRGGFVLATIHRAENADVPERWAGILEGIRRVGRNVAPVVWPVHPRVRERLAGIDLASVRLIDPLPYLDMQALIIGARVVVTDSGGLQKEAAFHDTPCVTVRDETEWVELVECGVNALAGSDPARMLTLVRAAEWPREGLPSGLFGDGRAAQEIAAHLRDSLRSE